MRPVLFPLSVAPLTDHSDRHFRAMMRRISPSVRLYTEMVVARGDLRRMTRGPGEEPVFAQLAGDEPRALAAAAIVAAARGFAGVDLNCGCPSAAAVHGGWGAVAMRSPRRVAASVAACSDASGLPVSIKCRLGTGQGGDELSTLVAAVARAGCRHVIVHARQAVLGGLSTRANRTVPPLDHAAVHRLAAAWPELAIELNGGITSLDQAHAHLTTPGPIAAATLGHGAATPPPDGLKRGAPGPSAAAPPCDGLKRGEPGPIAAATLGHGTAAPSRDGPGEGGRIAAVMIGRAAVDDPLMFAATDRGEAFAAVVEAMAGYLDRERVAGTPPGPVLRAMLGLPRGLPGGKRVRAAWAELARDPHADGRALAAAALPVLQRVRAASDRDVARPPGSEAAWLEPGPR